MLTLRPRWCSYHNVNSTAIDLAGNGRIQTPRPVAFFSQPSLESTSTRSLLSHWCQTQRRALKGASPSDRWPPLSICRPSMLSGGQELRLQRRPREPAPKNPVRPLFLFSLLHVCINAWQKLPFCHYRLTLCTLPSSECCNAAKVYFSLVCYIWGLAWAVDLLP